MENNIIRFDGPGEYEIIIQDEFKAGVLEFLEHALIKDSSSKNRQKQNYVILKVKDQAELVSFINILYHNRCTILAIKWQNKLQ